jgi:hypothetical protein
MPNDPFVKSKVKLLSFQATLIACLNARNPEIPIHSIRNNIVDSLFGLKIGTDRKSIQDKIRILACQIPHGLIVTDTQWAEQLLYPEKQNKEQLCHALLSSLAFRHVLLYLKK